MLATVKDNISSTQKKTSKNVYILKWTAVWTGLTRRGKSIRQTKTTSETVVSAGTYHWTSSEFIDLLPCNSSRGKAAASDSLSQIGTRTKLELRKLPPPMIRRRQYQGRRRSRRRKQSFSPRWLEFRCKAKTFFCMFSANMNTVLYETTMNRIEKGKVNQLSLCASLSLSLNFA